MLLILTTIWSKNSARSNSYYYEDYDYLSREAWLDEISMKRDQVETHAMIREMFQLTERQEEELVSERLFRTFCDMCMQLVLFNGEKVERRFWGKKRRKKATILDI